MAVVNAATLEALWVSFNTIFQQTLERTKTRIDDIASAVPSSTRIEHYPIAALTGRMREWVKDRVVQDLAAFEASVRNLTFEHTIGVPREDIEDDVTGAYALAIQQQAALGVLEPWLQVQDELGVGAFAESVGFDGVPFFSNSHVWQGMKGAAGAPQSNLTAAYLTAPAVYAGIKQMSAFVGPDGVVLMVQPTHFLFSPAMEQAVDQLFNVPLANPDADQPDALREVPEGESDQDADVDRQPVDDARLLEADQAGGQPGPPAAGADADGEARRPERVLPEALRLRHGLPRRSEGHRVVAGLRFAGHDGRPDDRGVTSAECGLRIEFRSPHSEIRHGATDELLRTD